MARISNSREMIENTNNLFSSKAGTRWPPQMDLSLNACENELADFIKNK